jgi:hypothetical protein
MKTRQTVAFILGLILVSTSAFPKDLLVDSSLWDRLITQNVSTQRQNEVLWKHRYESQCAKYGPTETKNTDNKDCIECRKMAEMGGINSEEFTNLMGPSAEYRQWAALNQAMDLNITSMNKSIPVMRSLRKSLAPAVKNPEALSKDPKLSRYVDSIKSNIFVYSQLAAEYEKVKDDPKQKPEAEAISLAMDKLVHVTPLILHQDVYPWVKKTQDFIKKNDGKFETGLMYLGFVQNQKPILSAIDNALRDQLGLMVQNTQSLEKLRKDENNLREKWRKLKGEDSKQSQSAKKNYSEKIDQMLFALPLLQTIYGTSPSQLPGLERAMCELQKRTEDRVKHNEDSAKHFSLIVGIGAGVATMGLAVPATGAATGGALLRTAAGVAAGTAPSALMDYGVVLRQNLEKCQNLFASATIAEPGMGIRDQYLDCVNEYQSASTFMGWGYAAGSALPLLKPISQLAKGSASALGLAKTQAKNALENARLDKFVPNVNERKEIEALTAELYKQRANQALAMAEQETMTDLPNIRQQVYAGVQSGKISTIQADEEFAKRYAKSVRDNEERILKKEIPKTDEDVRKVLQTCSPGAGMAK